MRSRRWRLATALGATALVGLLAVGVWLLRIVSKQLTWQSLLNATYATSVTPRGARTRESSRHYALDGNSLVLLDESEAEVQSTPAENYVYLPVRLDIVAGSSRSVDGSLAPGQIASYVAHGRAGEILDLTVRSDFDNGVLSVSGLTDGMTLVSRREYAN